MSMENLLRAAIEDRKHFTPKGQGIPKFVICDKCGTMVIDGKCWCNITALSDEDLDNLYVEWKEKKR